MGITAPPDHATLRKRFKELQLATNNVYQNWQVRVHRSLSWMKRAEELPEDLIDVRFVLYWVALNALYGRWDNGRNAPAQDDESRRKFARRLLELDYARISQLLHDLRPLLKPILGNPFLARCFWGNLDSTDSEREGKQDLFHLDGNLKNHAYERLLNQLFDRLYILRGQIMHGAATSGSKLNRKTLRECCDLLRQVVPTVISVVLERACDDEWPELCYPPMVKWQASRLNDIVDYRPERLITTSRIQAMRQRHIASVEDALLVAVEFQHRCRTENRRLRHSHSV